MKKSIFKRLILLIVCIVIPVAVGFVSYLITKDAMGLFDTVNKPPLSPPAWLFSVAWTILYILMGIGTFAVLLSNKEGKASVIIIYVLQLFFNFLWSPIFFLSKAYWFALVWLIVMLLMVILMTIRAAKVSKFAMVCFVPYVAWCLFATYLNAGIAMLN